MIYTVVIENGLVRQTFKTKADAIIYLMELKAKGINNCRIETKEVATKNKFHFGFKK